MDFALLPPEINSGRMYSGPGSGPMLAAASAWDGLAADLHAVGLGYDSALAELSAGWSGPTWAAMAAAVAPYAKWLHTTAAQAEQTAIQLRTAIAGYETAFVMTVPPPVVAANRSLLMTLLATNFLGQNTAAIAATEAHYAEMWAQDVSAMYGYAGSAAAATRLTTFTEPPQTTNPAGSANPPGASAPALLGTLAAAAVTGPAVELSIAGIEVLVDVIGSFGIDVLGTFLIDPLGAAVIGAEVLPLEELISSVTPVAASVGEAASISGLSVPPSWAVAAPSLVRQVGTVLPAASAGAAGETAIPVAEMATAGLAGRATAAVGRGGGTPAGTATRRRPTPPQPARPLLPAYGLLMGADIELRELAELRNAGVLTDEEYTEERRHLVGR